MIVAPIPLPGETTDKYAPAEYATRTEWLKAYGPDTPYPQRPTPHQPRHATAYPIPQHNAELIGTPQRFDRYVSSRGPVVPFHPATHVKARHALPDIYQDEHGRTWKRIGT